MTDRRLTGRRGMLGGLAMAAALPGGQARGRSRQPAEDTPIITVPGFGEFTGTLAPAKLPAKPVPGILLVHDGFGVTPQMQAYADRLAFEGYVALVVDLFRGKTAATDADAAALARGAVAEDVAIEAIAMWADWLRSRAFIDRKVGLVAFGPSCAWSLAAARRTEIQPMAFFYGRVQFSEDDAKRYPNHIIAHFGDRDDLAGPAWRYEMESRFRRIGSTRTHILSYPAGRNFANPLSRNYEKTVAQVAWNATLAYFIAQWGRPEK